ncbi:MAG: response regulator [Lutibacter sp.]|uniref:response regulator n=1 Tax=Lutibacter sp. TaxID=1925666 RepID=UPI00385E4677
MKKTVLLIESEITFRKYITEILELANYIIITAENGKKEIEMAKTFIPNIIICDILIPRLDGFDVLQIISKIPILAHIPFIFLAENIDYSDLRKGMNLGADDFLIKPFKETELLKAIESRLKRAEAFEHQTSNINRDIQIENIKNIKTFLSKKTIFSFKKNETIYCKENLSNHLFLIKKGKVKTYKINEDGKEFITGYFTNDQYFGYSSFVKHSSHFENSKAITNVKLYKINKSEINTIIKNNPKFLYEFIDLLTDNLIDIKEQLILLAYSSVRKKTARTLVRILQKTTIKEAEEINISKSDLANSIGIEYETLIRTLHAFKEEKLIKESKNGLKIINKKKLLQIQ